MRKHGRVMMTWLVVAAAVWLTGAAASSAAAPDAVADRAGAPVVSFGLSMKPGWGGEGDAYGATFGNTLVLRCAYLKGRSPRLATGEMLAVPQVVTATGSFVGCASWTLERYGGVPVPTGYVPR